MTEPEINTVATVFIDRRDKTLPHVDVYPLTPSEQQIWIDALEQGIRLRLVSSGLIRHLPSIDPTAPAIRPIAEALQVAEGLVNQAEAFAESITTFLEELNTATLDPAIGRLGAQISHMNIYTLTVGLPDVDIVLKHLGGHPGSISMGQDTAGRVHLRETGALNREFTAADYAPVIRRIVAEAQDIAASAEAFSGKLRRFMPTDR